MKLCVLILSLVYQLSKHFMIKVKIEIENSDQIDYKNINAINCT